MTIKYIIVSNLYFSATLVPVNASNSTDSSTTTSKNDTNTNGTETESSKKDKRQAQRGYTDVPLDEGFDLNSSPPPPAAFESDRPPYAESLNDLPGNYLGNFQKAGSTDSTSLPNIRDIDRSFFSQKAGFAAGATNTNQDNTAAAAATSKFLIFLPF